MDCVMIITINDVANNFSCDYTTATKITKLLLNASNASMVVKDIVDFDFAGVHYTLIKHKDTWHMIRSTATRSENISDVLT